MAKKASTSKFNLAKQLLGENVSAPVIAKIVGMSTGWIYAVKKFETYDELREYYRSKAKTPAKQESNPEAPIKQIMETLARIEQKLDQKKVIW